MTIAHEIVHVFTSYLLKDPFWHTPGDVTLPGWGSMINGREVGESGRFLENGVFGTIHPMEWTRASRYPCFS